MHTVNKPLVIAILAYQLLYFLAPVHGHVLPDLDHILEQVIANGGVISAVLFGHREDFIEIQLRNLVVAIDVEYVEAGLQHQISISQNQLHLVTKVGEVDWTLEIHNALQLVSHDRPIASRYELVKFPHFQLEWLLSNLLEVLFVDLAFQNLALFDNAVLDTFDQLLASLLLGLD